MLRPRIIPSLLLHDKGLVKTVNFKSPKYVGDPINAVRIFNEKEVDELAFFDIDATVLNNQPFKKGDSVTVRVVSITRDAFYFYSELQVQVNNGGLFSQPPANVRTNFVNVSPGSKKRTSGYFFLRNVTSASTVLK